MAGLDAVRRAPSLMYILSSTKGKPRGTRRSDRASLLTAMVEVAEILGGKVRVGTRADMGQRGGRGDPAG